VCALLVWLVPSASAQQPATQIKPDSAKQQQPKAKSLRPGYDLPDSLYLPIDSIRGDIDTIVFYTAKDSIVFDVDHKRMTLFNEATMQYQKEEMNAYTIVMDFEQNTLTAYSEAYDSVISSIVGPKTKDHPGYESRGKAGRAYS